MSDAVRPEPAPSNDPTARIAAIVERAAEHLNTPRRNIHDHPELGFAGYRTAGVVSAGPTHPGVAHRISTGCTGIMATEGEPSTWWEDFSTFSGRVASCQMLIGPGAPGRDSRLHTARHQPNERCIPPGIQALSRAVLELPC